jgi:predicted transposase YdaD
LTLSTHDPIIDDGIKIGREEEIEKGMEEGLELGLAILKAYKSGQTIQSIASMFEISHEKVKSIVHKLD